MPKVTVTTTVRATKAGRCSTRCPRLGLVMESVSGERNLVSRCHLLGKRLGIGLDNPPRHRKCIEAENGGKK